MTDERGPIQMSAAPVIADIVYGGLPFSERVGIALRRWADHHGVDATIGYGRDTFISSAQLNQDGGA